MSFEISNQGKKIYSLQCLRGIAAMMVVFHHIHFKSIQNNLDVPFSNDLSCLGVDLFFIVSGFIMSYTTQARERDMKSFLVARFTRIFPLYWVLSVVALSVFLIAPALVNSSGGQTGIVASFFLLPNGERFLIANGWTLSYEVVFYLIYAFSMILSYRNRDIVSSVVILMMISIKLFDPGTSHYLSFLTDGIFMEFVLGIVAFNLYNLVRIHMVLGLVFVLTGAALIASAYPDHHLPGDVGRFWGTALPLWLMFIGIMSMEGLFRRMRPLITIGDSSYSLYLIHPFVLSVCCLLYRKIAFDNLYVFMGSLFLISVLCGYLCHLTLEKRLIHYTRLIFARMDASSGKTGMITRS